MRFNKQRALFECINLILSILFIFPLALLFERMLFPSSPFLVLTASACLSVVGYILGRVSMYKTGEISIILCAIGAVGICVLIFLTAPGG